MALNLDERYPGRANPKTLDYPQGSFKNRTSPTAKDGTYLEQDWANDMLAFFQSLMKEAGISANGSVDTVQASQYFAALMQNIRGASIPFYGTTPSTNVGSIIYAIDRQQILLWQTIGTFTGYASAEVGKFTWGTSIATRPYEENLIGQTIDRSLAKYAALIAWADVNGHMVASGSWTKGAFHFSSLGGNNVRLPDLRDMFIRATGTDADTANARGLGSSQSSSIPDLAAALDFITTGGGKTDMFQRRVDDAGFQHQFSIVGISSDVTYLPAPGTRTRSTSVFQYGSKETRPGNLALHPRLAL